MAGLGKKLLKTSPVGYAAVKAVERKNDPERRAATAEAAATKQAAKAEATSTKQAAKAAAAATKQAQEAARGPLVAKFSPGILSIKLYQNGTIESKLGSGSVAGATARVDQAGSQRIFRDTRQAYLTIEGPDISISAKISSNSGLIVGAARKFAASVNKVAQQHTPANSPPSAETSIPDQIGKLAELRDKGVLTVEEFEAKKAELLDRI
jgi:putative oligomerization/nucleic acid binding protein